MLPYKQDIQLLKAIDKWNILTFLNDNRVDYKMEGKNIGQNFIGVSPCPNCGDTKYHWGIDHVKKYGSCFKCGYYAYPMRLLYIYGRMKYKDARNYLINLHGENLDVVDRVKEIFSERPDKKEYEILQKDKIITSTPITYMMLKNNKYLRNFFIERKLNLWHCKRYDLRIGTERKDNNKIVFPVYYRKKIVAYQWRNIIKKWYHTSNNCRNYLINWDNIQAGKALVLVEGFLDFTRIDSYIQCHFKNEIIATSGFSKSISAKQLEHLVAAKPSKLIVMFDSDSWFDYMKLKNKIPFNVDFAILPKGKDPNDLTWKELSEVFRQVANHSK